MKSNSGRIFWFSVCRKNIGLKGQKKSGYCTPDETFRLILLRVLEIPSKGTL